MGCGEATQILHQPSLSRLNHKSQTTAQCDVNATVLEKVWNAWQVDKRFQDYQDLIAQDDVDTALIANPDAYHAKVALAAIAVGKHVLVEKPMCISLREAGEIIAAQRQGGIYLTSVFDYGSFVCQFETGVDNIPVSTLIWRIIMRTRYCACNTTRLMSAIWPSACLSPKSDRTHRLCHDHQNKVLCGDWVKGCVW